jgi:hypothetical protein
MLGEALHGSRFDDTWKYRVGDYRILCNFEDSRLLVLVVEIGHRREVYRGTSRPPAAAKRHSNGFWVISKTVS